MSKKAPTEIALRAQAPEPGRLSTARGLDLKTLVWTRGRTFPLSSLESRRRRPKCGSRNIVVLFYPPTNAAIARRI